MYGLLKQSSLASYHHLSSCNSRVWQGSTLAARSISPHMLGHAVLEMPSDLRPTATFELDSTQRAYRPKGITRLTVDIPSSYNPERRAEEHSTPRWRTPEFIVYYVAFALAVPLMVWIPYRLSTREYSFTLEREDALTREEQLLIQTTLSTRVRFHRDGCSDDKW